MTINRHWSLGAKLTLVGTPFICWRCCLPPPCGSRGSSMAVPPRSTRPVACACSRTAWPGRGSALARPVPCAIRPASLTAAWRHCALRRPRAAAVCFLGRHGQRTLREVKALDAFTGALDRHPGPDMHALRAETVSFASTLTRSSRPSKPTWRTGRRFSPLADERAGNGCDRRCRLFTAAICSFWSQSASSSRRSRKSRAGTLTPGWNANDGRIWHPGRWLQRHGRAFAVHVPRSGAQGAEKTAELEEKHERLECTRSRPW